MVSFIFIYKGSGGRQTMLTDFFRNNLDLEGSQRDCHECTPVHTKRMPSAAAGSAGKLHQLNQLTH